MAENVYRLNYVCMCVCMLCQYISVLLIPKIETFTLNALSLRSIQSTVKYEALRRCGIEKQSIHIIHARH